MIAIKKFKKPIEEARLSGDCEKEKKFLVEATHLWTDLVFRDYDVKLDIINPENIPTEGPVTYIANHESYADVFALMNAIPHQIGFIAKEDFRKIPFFSTWLERARSLFITRGDARASLKVINKGVEYLKDGFSMVIFPEGTRSHSSAVAPFKAGAFKLATKAKVPIIPVSIEGGYHCFEEEGRFKKGVTIHLMFHEAIQTADLSREELVRIPEKVENTIRNGVEEILKTRV